MRKVTEVLLPGVGVREEFTAASGQRVAVVSHRSGRYELALYRHDDPDACRTFLELDREDAATLAHILGASEMAATEAAMQRIEGLAIDWLRVSEGSDAVASTIGAGRYRSRTGTSIVAILRQEQTFPAPGADFELAAGDVAVSVGTPEGLMQLRSLLGA